MLLWWHVDGSDGPNYNSHYSSTNNTGSGATTADDGEKGSKIRQRRRQAFGRKVLQILFATTVVVSTMSVFIVKYHHSPKIRGSRTTTNHAVTERADAAVANPIFHSNSQHHHSGPEDDNHHVIDTLPVNSIYRLSMKDSNGIVQSLSQYIGMVTLVVNTACQWGKTDKSFTELAILQDKLSSGHNHKFSVLAFPILDFHQEYSSDAEIQSFLQEHYPDMIHFPVFSVSTLATNPVYQTLQQQELRPKSSSFASHADHHHHHHHHPNVVQHNFFKYLVGPDGMAVQLYPKSRDPLTLLSEIEQFMAQ